MNERIEKLAEQAGIWKPTHDHKTWVRGEYISSPGELEKFAELVVQECIRTIQLGITRGGTTTEKYLRSMSHIKDIKEHFGVKE